MSLQSNIVRNKLTGLGISQQLFSAYVGISVNQMSLFCSGVRDLSNSDTERINHALTALEDLSAALAPVPVDFRRIDEVKSLLRQHKQGELDQLIQATRATSFGHAAVASTRNQSTTENEPVGL